MNKLRAFVNFLKQIDYGDLTFAIQMALLAVCTFALLQESRKLNQEIQQLRKYIHDQNTQNQCGLENVR